MYDLRLIFLKWHKQTDRQTDRQTDTLTDRGYLRFIEILSDLIKSLVFPIVNVPISVALGSPG